MINNKGKDQEKKKKLNLLIVAILYSFQILKCSFFKSYQNVPLKHLSPVCEEKLHTPAAKQLKLWKQQQFWNSHYVFTVHKIFNYLQEIIYLVLIIISSMRLWENTLKNSTFLPRECMFPCIHSYPYILNRSLNRQF